MSPQRPDRELIQATRSFVGESRPQSWWHVISTFALIGVAAAVAAAAPYWPARLVASVLEGLVAVRGFILFHDYMHNAILRKSTIARALMYSYGVLVLTPPRVWRDTHNYHHNHNSKIVGSHVGAYPILTTDMWRRLPRSQRLRYRIARHPLTILFGYVTIFLYGMCVSSFLRRPKHHFDSAIALVVHVALVAVIWALWGPSVLLLAYVVPLAIACMAGAYLFYAQHNFEEMEVRSRERWTFAGAALDSSSYMPLGPIGRWFTGNIGYHHVHHLNPAIPFYRLPEAFAAIPELQARAKVTRLSIRDIANNFRLGLWDPEQGRMVGYPPRTAAPAGHGPQELG